MYLMIFFIVATIVSIIIATIYYNKFENDSSSDILALPSAIFTVIAIVFFLVSLICGIVCVCENTNTHAQIEKYEAKREVLVYQIENETYLNDNNIGTYELFKDIYEFNQDVLSGKIGHENPWYSWFYGEYYEYIEPISFNK